MLKASRAPPPPSDDDDEDQDDVIRPHNVRLMEKSKRFPHHPVSCWQESWSRSAASVSPIKSSLANPRALLIWPVLTDHVFHFLYSSRFSSCLTCQTWWSWRVRSLQELVTPSLLLSFLSLFLTRSFLPCFIWKFNVKESAWIMLQRHDKNLSCIMLRALANMTR